MSPFGIIFGEADYIWNSLAIQSEDDIDLQEIHRTYFVRS